MILTGRTAGGILVMTNGAGSAVKHIVPYEYTYGDAAFLFAPETDSPSNQDVIMSVRIPIRLADSEGHAQAFEATRTTHRARGILGFDGLVNWSERCARLQSEAIQTTQALEQFTQEHAPCYIRRIVESYGYGMSEYSGSEAITRALKDLDEAEGRDFTVNSIITPATRAVMRDIIEADSIGDEDDAVVELGDRAYAPGQYMHNRLIYDMTSHLGGAFYKVCYSYLMMLAGYSVED